MWPMSSLRQRLIDEKFLRHTEWTRRMGIAGLIGIGGVISVPIGIFIVIPHTISAVAGPSTLLSLLIGFIIFIITGLHIAELTSAMPKSCLLYNFAYTSMGEAPAFLIAWISLFDYTVAIATVSRAWSDHVNILFNGIVDRYLRPQGYRQLPSAIASGNHCDFAAMLVILGSMCVMCCSLRVAGTVSAVLFVLSLLTISSSIFVGFFFADPARWIHSGFFTHGIPGLLRGVSFILVAFSGVEALTFVLDESHHPRRRLPRLLPTAITALALFFFFVTMTSTLAVDFTQLENGYLLPEMFRPLKAPAARYMMTVGSVCGLSGTCIAIFLPATRMLASVCEDRLLPGAKLLARRNSKRGAPYVAVVIVAFVSAALLFVDREAIFNVVTLNMPLRMLVMAYLVYDQHFRLDPIGIPRETSKYQHFGKKNVRVCSVNSLSNSVDMVDCCSDTTGDEDAEGENSDSSSGEVIQMYFAKYESEKLQRRLEGQQRRQFHRTDERSTLLIVNSKAVNDTEKRPNNLAMTNNDSASPVHYATIDTDCNASTAAVIDAKCEEKNCTRGHSVGKKSSRDPIEHNCVASPCSPDDQDSLYEMSQNHRHRVHLYDREIPELPYIGRFHGGTAARSTSPVDQSSHARRARHVLFVYMVLCAVFGMALARTDNGVPEIWPASIALLALISIIFVTVVACRLRTNDYISQRKHKAIGFPYLTLLAIFLLIVTMCAAPALVYAKVIGWTVIGLVVYFAYGHSHSRERRDNQAKIYCNGERFDSSHAIVGNSMTFTNDSLVTVVK